MPADKKSIIPETTAVEGVYADIEVTAVAVPSAPPLEVRGGAAGRPTALADIVDALKVQMHVDGTLVEIIDKCCEQLGVESTGSLLDRANLCYEALFKSSSSSSSAAPVPTKSKSKPKSKPKPEPGPKFTDAMLVDSRWQAGSGGDYHQNPWRFTANHRFVTERDGCNGRWSLNPCKGAGGLRLRMDWEAGQNGNWAEFDLLGFGNDPLFKNVGSSYGFMRSWNIRCCGGPAADIGTHTGASASTTSVPTTVGVGMKMMDMPTFPEAVAKMKAVRARNPKFGPRDDQLKAHAWFESKGWKDQFPVHRAAMHGDAEYISSLVIAGRDPNEKMTPWYNSEPLGWAASFNQLDCIIALIESGADPRRPKNDAGFTPMGDANREKHSAAAEMLETFIFYLNGANVTPSAGYEENYAIIWCPIAGHPDFDKGAYYDSFGLCCYTNRKEGGHDEDLVEPWLCWPVTLGCWVGTLCYQPCGIIWWGQCPWFGDCPCTEQRVTNHFAQKYPEIVTRGPAKIRRDNL